MLTLGIETSCDETSVAVIDEQFNINLEQENKDE